MFRRFLCRIGFHDWWAFNGQAGFYAYGDQTFIQYERKCLRCDKREIKGAWFDA